MLGSRASRWINNRCILFENSRIQLSVHATRSLLLQNNEEREKPVRQLKVWRQPSPVDDSPLSLFYRPPAKNKQLHLPKRRFSFAPHEIFRWFRKHQTNYLKYSQRFMTERHEALGCDLAAAQFLVTRGGKVKFHGQTDWIVMNEDKTMELPCRYDPSWQLTHVDASGVPLYYEGIENFQNLTRVIWASFRNNPNFDDWCVDKLTAHFPNIEYLDISECKNITERSLEGVFKFFNVKTIIVTDWHKRPSFELTCTMLEDCIPGLTVEIREPEEKSEAKGVRSKGNNV